jgi:hypothetical protein
MSGGEVDDAEATHAKADSVLGEEAGVVGTAVGHKVAHALQRDGIDVRVFAELEYSRNPTHVLF